MLAVLTMNLDTLISVSSRGQRCSADRSLEPYGALESSGEFGGLVGLLKVRANGQDLIGWHTKTDVEELTAVEYTGVSDNSTNDRVEVWQRPQDWLRRPTKVAVGQ